MAKRKRKIPWDQIKAKFLTSTNNLQQIADEFKVSRGTIAAKIHREKWERNETLLQHVATRVDLEVKRSNLIAKEADLPPVVKATIEKEVTSRSEVVRLLTGLKTQLVEDVVAMWDHDKAIEPIPGRPHSNDKYSKARIVTEIAEKAKKSILGDAPLMAEEVEENEDDAILVIPVPKTELDRVNSIEKEEDGSR